MSDSHSVTVRTDTDKTGLALKNDVVDPEVARFEAWYAKPQNAGTGLTAIERGILALYLHARLSGKL